jgi:hypothetical protein
MLIIDGENFKVDVLSCKRTADFLDKHAKEHGTAADSYTNAENHLQIICIRSAVQSVADAVLAVCKERKLTDAKLYASHWA